MAAERVSIEDLETAEFGRTTCRCPKCHSGELTATEVTEALMDFTISAGQIIRDTHTDEFGDIIGLRLRCRSCGHRWSPRRAKSVDQLVAATAA